MDLNKKDLFSSIFLILFAGFIVFCAYQLTIGSTRKPGSGFFPFYLAIILGLLSIINFTKTIARRKITVEQTETLKTDINWKNIIVAVVVLFLYAPALKILGFLPATFLFSACFLRFIEPQRWSAVFGIGAAMAIISYFIFQYWLKLQFPIGILGI